MSLTMSLTEYVRSRLICSPNDVCSLWRHRARSLRPASLAFSRAWWHKQIKLTRSWSCLFYHAQTTPSSEYNLLQPNPGGQHLIKLWNLHNIKLLIIVLVYTKPANSQQKKKWMLSGQNSAGKVITHARVHCVLQTSGQCRISQAWVANQSRRKCWTITGLVYTVVLN